MACPEASDHLEPATAVLVADCDPCVRSALRLVLNEATGARRVREAGDANELLRDAAINRPDLVLLDWKLPGLRADEVFAALHRCAPDAIVVVMSVRAETRSAALSAGADGFVCKSDDPMGLLATLRRLVPSD